MGKYFGRSPTYGMTDREISARAQALGVSIADYKRATRAQIGAGASLVGTSRGAARQYGAAQDLPDWLEGLVSGGYGGGGYRPQTAEEAAALKAQAERERAAAALYGAQATDIPLARELARRMGLAEIGATQAGLAANPRRIFEAIFHQARIKPTEMAKSLQERMTIPGFKRGGVIARVGEAGEEYLYADPGKDGVVVVAPKRRGERPTSQNALGAVLQQLEKGGIVSPGKARKTLRHGEVHGRKLSEKQKGLFGLIAGGSAPTRLRKAQGGLSTWGPEYGLPQSVSGEMEELRKRGTKTVLGAIRPAVRGTSLFDPMGAGGRFTPEQAGFLRGINLRQFRKLSPTQQKALFSTLSAGEIEPEDYLESMQRQFAGFNPVGVGTRARFSGILGRR